MQLSPEQSRAVTRSGQDSCCVAGPGSGKTRVLVERFAWLVGSGIDPESILAITFTEKAARELKSRLAARFQSDPTTRQRIER
ncbi:MAG TPA: UvrD-helicase domain-containing protein, partial [Bryobacteraceae bacterium]|nr:UvrD-helicase domain-containing protein [Bryobacteraceae bacterium]